jgi:hypothetical protein
MRAADRLGCDVTGGPMLAPRHRAAGAQSLIEGDAMATVVMQRRGVWWDAAL